jgi:Fe-S-cluster containining protein
MTECNRCGHCCEHLQLNFTKAELRAYVGDTGGSASTPVTRDHLANARFILGHWHRASGGGTATIYACDAFDPTTRLCTAQEDRPPICAGYPWYDAPPGWVTKQLPSPCSFNADVGVEVQLGPSS